MRYKFLGMVALFYALLCVFAYGPVRADTLELANGKLLEGSYITSNESYFIFDVGDEIQAIPVEEVAVLYLSNGVEAMLSSADAPAPSALTVPPGTRLLIVTTETIDSSRHRVGHRFQAQLKGNLVVDKTVVAKQGSSVFGQISQATRSRRLVGRSELTVELTDIKIDGQIFPISTTEVQFQGSSTAAQTVGRTARGAAIGALFGGGSGAATGAAIGTAGSIVTRGENINIPRGTLLETSLATPLVVQ